MAEAGPPAEELRRPWHGASDRDDAPEVQAIRLHRAEVEAIMAYRRTAPGSAAQARAWRRVAALRERRLALIPEGLAARLPPLPAPPPDTLSAWQKLRRRLRFGRS